MKKTYQNATCKNILKNTPHFMGKLNLISKYQISPRYFKAFQSIQYIFCHFCQVYVTIERYCFYFKNI